MTRVTYDMQKLGEAVSIMALGSGPLKARLRDTIIPLLTLRTSGIHNKKRVGELDSICERLMGGALDDLSENEALELARHIVQLESSNWHDVVWELEDQLRERSQEGPR